MTQAEAGRIRILYPFVGDDVGGSHISALKLIEALDPARYEPCIALHSTDGMLASYLADHSIRFRSAPGDVISSGFAGAIVYATRTLPVLRRFLRDEAVDVVHTNDGRIHATWGPATFGHRTRLVWHHRGDPTARGVNWLAPLVADRLVTVSRFARPTRPLLPIENRWSIVHSPFDHPPTRDGTGKDGTAERMRSALREELGLGPSARFVGFFGGFVARKRPALMADIVARMRAAHPGIDIHAVLFGHPPPDGTHLDRRTMERAAQLGVSARVHLMGFRQPIAPWMQAIDAMLVPALNEPFGRTLIEAMLLGVPVIATRHGGNTEAIEHGVDGFLVDPHAADAFVAPIHAMLSDEPLRVLVTTEARKRALDRYGTARHVGAIGDLYRDLMRPSRSGHLTRSTAQEFAP